MALHKSEILFFILLAFMGGVSAASIFHWSQNLILILTALSIGIIGVSSYNKTFSYAGILTGTLLLVFALGIIRFNYVSFSKSILLQFTGIEAGGKGIAVNLNGYIDGESGMSGGISRFVFRAKQIEAGDRVLEINERTLVSAGAFPEHGYGDFLALSGTLKFPENFNSFDYASYLKKEGVFTLMPFPKIQTVAPAGLGRFEKLKIGFYKKIFAVKNKFQAAVSRSVAEPNASFINGILLGSRQEIPDKLKESFNTTGTSHILAVSGYNISVIADAVLLGLIWFMRRRKAFWVSVGLIILFTIITGASASVVRAAIMGLLFLFASGYGRLSDARNSVVLAGAAMVLFNPMILVFDVGFQFSFAAVLGLIYVYPFFNSKTEKIPKIAGLKEIVLMTLSAQFFVFPLLIYYFKNLSLVSVFANILVLPFIPAAMFLGFLSGLAGMVFAPLGQIAGFAAWAITAFQLKSIEFFASLPFASVPVSIGWIGLIIINALLILAAVSLNRQKID